MNTPTKQNIQWVTIVLVTFALGSGASWYATEGRENACRAGFTFINSSMVCENEPVIKKTGYVVLYSQLQSFIAQEKAAGRVEDVSMYFRDLKGGPVFGINETADFAPASLLKLPLAFVFLTWAEREPDVLTRKVRYEHQELSLSQVYKPSAEIEVGGMYTIEELLERMLVYSDNSAYDALITYLDENGESDRLFETLNELGIIGVAGEPEEIISVRRYAALFRILYNVSYLNPELSEKMLMWLAASDFKDGLRAGVPSEIRVAHKFGEREQSDGVKQLHDCGIVFFPENPYQLCVMTRGKDIAELAHIVETISRMMYEEVNSRRI